MKIIIFGTGKIAKDLMNYPLGTGVQILFFVDNNSDKWEKLFNDKYLIKSPSEIEKNNYDYIIIATEKGMVDIFQQLSEIGISKDKIICPEWKNIEYVRQEIDYIFAIQKKAIFDDIKSLARDIDYVKQSLGRIESRQLSNEKDITKSEFKVFSQWGEDGIIEYLVRNVNISRKVFVEFGVQNYKESNTRWLLQNHNWSGLVMDGNEKDIEFIRKDDIYWRYNIKAVKEFITAENINELLISNGIEGDIGLLSVDIDGNDYWVWKAITAINPAIVICEYNHRFGSQRSVTIPYNPTFERSKAHYSNVYFGASLRAMVSLGTKKGYSLVAVNENGNDAFFVRNELLNENVKEVKIEDIFKNGQFRESRDKDGDLCFVDLNTELELISNLPLLEV